MNKETLRMQMLAGVITESQYKAQLVKEGQEIVMKDGYELTDEIMDLASRYDAFYMYIDNYGQMKDAERKNKEIMDKLRPLGVERINQTF